MPKSTTPEAPLPDLEDDGRSFLQRWSERKVDAKSEPGPPVETDPGSIEGGTSNADASANPAGETAEVPPPVTEADLENLTYESDYTKFLGDNAPDALRRRALRTLWRSDPILANLDGLCDYDDDYTDAALAVKVLQTAHKVGQGFLTDEDLAANRARGEPKVEEVVAATSDAELDEDDSEDIEDFDEENELTEGEASVATAQNEDTTLTQAASEVTDNSADQPAAGDAETVETVKS